MKADRDEQGQIRSSRTFDRPQITNFCYRLGTQSLSTFDPWITRSPLTIPLLSVRIFPNKNFLKTSFQSGLFGNQFQQSRNYLSQLGSFTAACTSPAAALQTNIYQQQLIQSIQQVASDQLESNKLMESQSSQSFESVFGKETPDSR